MEKNLQTMENQMHQQVTKYVQLVDLFETQLNERSATWHKRKNSREFRQKATMKLISLIASGIIALIAVILFITKVA
ncbi:MAG: hypothetical protein IKK75_09185 [Clostridia bacterium]|nr:hypothetical protein [Clostridia bacterium]